MSFIKFLFAPKNDLPVNIIAVEDSEVLFISRNDFTTWMQKDAQVLQNFLMLISGRSRFLSDKIMFLSLKNIKNRVAEYLLGKLTDDKCSVIQLTETQQDIADFFGVLIFGFVNRMSTPANDHIRRCARCYHLRITQDVKDRVSNVLAVVQVQPFLVGTQAGVVKQDVPQHGK